MKYLILIVALLCAGCSMEPVFVYRSYSAKAVRYVDPAWSGTTSIYVWKPICKEEVYEYGKASYFRDCN